MEKLRSKKGLGIDWIKELPPCLKEGMFLWHIAVSGFIHPKINLVVVGDNSGQFNCISALGKLHAGAVGPEVTSIYSPLSIFCFVDIFP